MQGFPSLYSSPLSFRKFRFPRVNLFACQLENAVCKSEIQTFVFFSLPFELPVAIHRCLTSRIIFSWTSMKLMHLIHYISPQTLQWCTYAKYPRTRQCKHDANYIQRQNGHNYFWSNLAAKAHCTVIQLYTRRITSARMLAYERHVTSRT